MNPKSVFIPKSVIDEALATPPVKGKHPIASFKERLALLGVPSGTIEILENYQVERFENPTELHERVADLWIGLEGAVIFVVGGELVDRTAHPTKQFEWKGTSITGGVEHVVGPGDILYIPPGDPHTHFGSGRLYIVKIPVIISVPGV